jgi:hypothetical protein
VPRWTLLLETDDESVAELLRRGLYFNDGEAFNEAMRLVYSGDIVRLRILDAEDEGADRP